MPSYNFYNSARQLGTKPKDQMLETYDELLNERFELATNVETVQTETTFASLIFGNITVRIDSVVGENGAKLSDDFRKVIFNDKIKRGLGSKYIFDSSTWLAINYDIYAKPTKSVIIRKCRNTLRFIDRETGFLIEEPCAVENYNVKEPRPFLRQAVVVPDGYIIVDVQGNERTRKIKDNQRFILNGQAYKVWNIQNVLDEPTDGVNPPLISLVLGRDLLNPDVDDVVDGIANVNEHQYQLNIVQTNFEQLVGFTGKLDAVVVTGNEPVNRAVQWESSNTDVGTVDELGNIELLTEGVVTFKCSLVGNPYIYDTIDVKVVGTILDTEQVVILPQDFRILEQEQQTYSVYQYVNGFANTDTFTFTSIPSSNYVMTIINGNSFSVKNLKRSLSPLVVTATNDITLITTTINITLGGVF